MGIIYDIENIREELSNDPNSIIIGEIRRLEEYSLNLYQRNYEVLHQLLKDIQFSPDIDRADLMSRIHQGKHYALRMEILFRLHNYVASAKSLVDHSRRVYEKAYKSKDSIDRYNNEVDNRFENNGLVQFMHKLRDMCQHYKIPNLITSFEIISDDFDFLLKREGLLQFKGWNSKSKNFIENHDGPIDLVYVIEEYNDIIIDFHNWVNTHYKELYSEELEKLNEITDKLNQKKRKLFLRELNDALENPKGDPIHTIRFTLAGALTPDESNRLIDFEDNDRAWIEEALKIIQSKIDIPYGIVDEIYSFIDS